MTARFHHKESYVALTETVVELSDWNLDSMGGAQGEGVGYPARIYLIRDLKPINQDAHDMRAAALAAEALAREDSESVSWARARGHDLDRLSNDLMGLSRMPGETDASLRRRLSNHIRRPV